MTQAKTTKIKWTGPASRIPELGVEVQPGDTIDVPEGTTLAGEGTNWTQAKTPKAPKPETPEEQ